MLETIIDMQCDCPDPECKVKDPSPYVITLMANSTRDVELLREIVALVDGQLSRAPLRHLADLDTLVQAKRELEKIFATNDVFRMMGGLGRPPASGIVVPPDQEVDEFNNLKEIDTDMLASEKD